MTNTKALLSSLVLLAASHATSAQSLKDAVTTLKVGNWSVLRSVDTMTDKLSCTGVYKSNYGVQLTPDSLYVKISGGIQSITMRFGDFPPQSMRLPQKLEKDVGTVIIEGREFSQAVETNRLRLQVLTLVRGVATEDLDTTGVQAAVEHIRAGCPMPAPVAALVVIPAVAPVSEAKAVVSFEKACSDQLVLRLRTAGVTEKQIKSACYIN
jgi:hypothetical protein